MKRTGRSELPRGRKVLRDQAVRVRGRHAEHQERFDLRAPRALMRQLTFCSEGLTPVISSSSLLVLTQHGLTLRGLLAGHMLTWSATRCTRSA